MTLEELGTPEGIQLLLGRKLKPSTTPIRELISGGSVLVTGAGGSIGTQLCLQLIAMQPKVIVLYEMSEYALYQIDQTLRERAGRGATRIVPVLGNLSSCSQIQRLLEAYKIDTVYHAAAYKHVPLVERNPIIGLENNLWGTKNLVDAARACGIKNLTLISTDKAVNPTNIMGASKRVAEYITLAGEHPYKVVRFGNVLWSTGSVVPLFYRQLKGGLPVTITDPLVTRYFMSISEAVDLILQSRVVDGAICVLDMGEQIRIELIARQLASLMKIEPTIEYIGLRPGEKLYEELTLGEHLKRTTHQFIKVAQEDVPSYESLSGWLLHIRNLCETGDLGGVRTLLGQIVPGYLPSCGIMDDMWLEANVFNAAASFDDCYAEAAP